jgi:rhodanese-related sulfurtransferase
MPSTLSKWIPFGSVPEIGAIELWRTIESGEVQLIDVRTSQEWRFSAIEGSWNIPITSFNRETVESLELDKTKPVVYQLQPGNRRIPGTR